MANFGKAEISLLFKPAASVPLLKILNVSERTGMSVVPRSSDVLRCKNSRPEVYTDVHFCTVYFKRLTEKFVSNAAGYAEALEIRRIYFATV